MSQDQIKKITIAGDITIDWNIARIKKTRDARHTWNAYDRTRAISQPGGAAMLADLLKAIVKNLKKNHDLECELDTLTGIPRKLNPELGHFHHSYATWAPFPLDSRKEKDGYVWRVAEFLGLDRNLDGKPKSRAVSRTAADKPASDLLIIDDANLGFRETGQAWEELLTTSASTEWILLKMARPVANGALWEKLQQEYANKLIVVMTLDDLRRSEVRISRKYSWERTAEDLLWAFSYGNALQALRRCAHVIVSFDTAGAFHFARKGETFEARLFYDPAVIEGEWGGEHKGHMIGFTCCLTSAIARQVLLNSAKPKIATGIQSGVHAMRYLQKFGYGPFERDLAKIKLKFPTASLAECMREDDPPLEQISIPSFGEEIGGESSRTVGNNWTILGALQQNRPIEDIATRIVIDGLDAVLPGVPVGRFGKMVTADRAEIEALLSVSSVIREYCHRPPNRPLSIAVFGPPGSGKSFAVQQVATSLQNVETATLTFNLSQFTDAEELLAAFHQVRDVVLSGKMPLVFWDEFDANLDDQQLGWLRYFLSPMQDGTFQDGQITHPIGRCLFIFAGGTSGNFEEFGTKLSETERKSAKVPDFISRLKGYLNIPGINQQDRTATSGAADPFYQIRRAIMLRSTFEREVPQICHLNGKAKIIDIDAGVLQAFLNVGDYKHGARSMRSIVAMSNLAGKTRFERSCLPAESQLDVHVNGKEFMAHVFRLELTDEQILKLATFANAKFQSVNGGEANEESRSMTTIEKFNQLSDDEKAQNIGVIRDIENKLARIGYVMAPMQVNTISPIFTPGEIDKLAVDEHERWMQAHVANGWQFSETRDDENKLHPCLVGWEKLPDDEKEKDRLFVRMIPEILAAAGFTMVKV